MLQGIQLVQLFPYGRYSESPQSIVGYITRDRIKTVISVVVRSSSVTVNDSILLLWNCSVVVWCAQPNQSCMNWLNVFISVFCSFDRAAGLIGYTWPQYSGVSAAAFHLQLCWNKATKQRGLKQCIVLCLRWNYYCKKRKEKKEKLNYCRRRQCSIFFFLLQCLALDW